MTLDALSRSAYTPDHEAFRDTVRQFVAKEIEPNAAQWDEDGLIPKDVWPKAGELGLLCPTVPEEYGGLGLDFGYNAIIDEEIGYGTDVATGFSLQSDIVANYHHRLWVARSRRRIGCPRWCRAKSSPRLR